MNKQRVSYTIQNIPREIWIKFRVILAKKDLHVSKIFRAVIVDFVNKYK